MVTSNEIYHILIATHSVLHYLEIKIFADIIKYLYLKVRLFWIMWWTLNPIASILLRVTHRSIKQKSRNECINRGRYWRDTVIKWKCQYKSDTKRSNELIKISPKLSRKYVSNITCILDSWSLEIWVNSFHKITSFVACISQFFITETKYLTAAT